MTNFSYAILSAKFSLGKDPNGAAVFLINCVLEALGTGKCLKDLFPWQNHLQQIVAGAKTERAIKSNVMEQCKLNGLRLTTRGTISGLNMEVSFVCSVLMALGAIKAENSDER